ncbi:MAG: hypothetical protein HUJ30_08535, partial [Gammaproteobacteria bacterium]|nr:hypothetical protein [Gammaproteobacteria bacterium]
MEETASKSINNDEISLSDLIKVLIRRKNTIYVVMALVVMLAIAAALLLPKKYQYSTSIEIGTMIVKDDIRLIDDPQTLLAKITESYIPATLAEYYENNPEDETGYMITARIPKKSEIIVLEAKGRETSEAVYKLLENQIVARIVDDHDRFIGVLRKEYEIKINKISNEVLSAQDQVTLYKNNLKRIDDNIRLLKTQIKQIQQLVSDGIANRRKAVREVKNQATAMTLLMIDNEIQQNQQRLDALEEKMSITLSNQRDNTEKKLADAKRNVNDKLN